MRDSETWQDYEGEIDRDKYYDIVLTTTERVERNCVYKSTNWGDGFMTESGAMIPSGMVSQYRESDNQGEEEEPEEQQFNISVKSPALAHALTHSEGNLDSMIEGILVTMIGDYEDSNHAVDWAQRKDIYARNGFRKVMKTRLTNWFKGEKIQ